MLLTTVKNRHGKATHDIILLHDNAHPNLAHRVQNQLNAM